MPAIHPRFAINADAAAVQHIGLPSEWERFEGIDFSDTGKVMAVASAGNHCVLLYRRKDDGRFGEIPFGLMVKETHKLVYPHDVAFVTHGDVQLLAVAQRGGAVVYERQGPGDSYGPDRAWEFTGPDFWNSLAFVPPHCDCLAVCSETLQTVSFFRQVSLSPVRFGDAPEFELRHESIVRPDGLAFSNCGRWIAVANHGSQCVSIFGRRNRVLTGGRLRYGPEPVTIIKDPQFRFPHSVVFTPRTNHLVVTNAGANHFAVYAPERHLSGTRWSQVPVLRVTAHDDETFRRVSAENEMEGGPKGVAVFEDSLAVCNPEFGIKIYSFQEG